MTSTEQESVKEKEQHAKREREYYRKHREEILAKKKQKYRELKPLSTVRSDVFYIKEPEVTGWDTEADVNGNIFLLSCYDASTATSFSLFILDLKDKEEIIDFLYKHAKQYNFFFNLKYDTFAILKPFLNEENQEIMRKGEQIKIGKYLITYIQGKHLSITVKHGVQKDFWDVATFFHNKSLVEHEEEDENQRRVSLNQIYKYFFNEEKIADELGIDVKLFTEDYIRQNKEKIIKYCEDDARKACNLGIEQKKTLYSVLGAYPKNLYSQASVAKAYLALKHPNQEFLYYKTILKACDKGYTDDKGNHYNINSDELHTYIMRAYNGGLFHQFYLGKIDNAKVLDVNSMYPSIYVNFTDVEDAEIEIAFEYKRTDPKDYSFWHVKLQYSEKYPIPYNTVIKNVEHKLYPYSLELIDAYITGAELDFFAEIGLKFQVVKGYIFHTKGIKAFEDYKQLYDMRKEYKNKITQLKKEGKIEEMHKYEILSETVKTILNSTYGVFCESRERMTKWTNFIYGSYITARGRVILYRLLKEAYDRNKEVYGLATDSAMIDSDYERETSDLLGEWKIEAKGDFIIYAKGVILELKGAMVVWKARRSIRNLSPEDFIKPDKWNDDYTIDYSIFSPLGLKEAVIRHKLNEVNKFEERKKTFDLRSNVDNYDIKAPTVKEIISTKIKTKPYLITPNDPEFPLRFRDVKIKDFHKNLRIARIRMLKGK
ncbi:MAG: hypothetical protein QW478_08405 [Candidatus Micrarchaeaceae archaeon]